ncbi:hypothetical protein ACIQ9R_36015 [Streptomyces sp. NPDC094447]|uniref:hypothetical protein n=1 Tax=Streptomyces sp. NPDC094447 TaxID=3366062 RepID=UPI0038136641
MTPPKYPTTLIVTASVVDDDQVVAVQVPVSAVLVAEGTGLVPRSYVEDMVRQRLLNAAPSLAASLGTKDVAVMWSDRPEVTADE